MNVDQVYRLIQYAAAKNKEQGYISPEDFNQTLMPLAQDSYVDYLLGEYQRYNLQRPVSVVEFSGNERLRDSISPLIYNTVLPVNSTTGIAPFPSDYEYTDAMWTLYGLYRIRFTQQEKLWSTYRSRIDPVSSNPIYSFREEGFWFHPNDIGSARLSYVRKAPPIRWGYTMDGDGLPVYNPLTSQQPVWSDTDMIQVIMRALALVGVNLQLNVVMQYANDIKQTGA